MTYDHSDAPLRFDPNPFQQDLMPSFSSNTVPRYLFRISAPKTAGRTTASEIIPPALISCQVDNTKDIFRLKPENAAALLNAHLRWQKTHEPNCNLISWTSSLLFALQYGLYRHLKDYDKPDLAQVFLLIIDTSQLPKGIFVKDIEAINSINFYSHGQIKDLSDLFKLRKGEWYFGEYLTQGKLNIEGACAVTSMQKMIDLGLFELQPDLEDRDKWNSWADRVVELRRPIKYSRDSPLVTRTEVRKAIFIAQGCFGDRWTVPVAAMLLALKPRKKDDPVILNGFEAMFKGKW